LTSQPERAEDATMVLQLRDRRGAVIGEVTRFREYSFNSHFLTPTDHFSFVLGDESARRSILDGIFVGQEVTLSINGYVQAGGFIDRVRPKTARGGGTEFHIEGRDWLSPAVDANMNPWRTKFTATNTLLDVIVQSFAPYGFGGVGQILASDEANANIITGQHRGPRTSKKGKVIKSFLSHQLKPYPREGVYAFCSRMSQRFGLSIWASADGENLIVDEPDFTQKAIYDIRHKLETGETTYEEGELDANGENQPSVIIATGYGGGGDNDHTRMKVAMVNEITGVDLNGNIRPEVEVILKDELPEYPSGLLPLRAEVAEVRMPDARVRAVYVHDDESKTIDELEDFTRREMALRQQHAFVARFTFEGHTLKGVPFYTNSIANVDDDVLELKNRMWCISRTFTKSRTSGTRTNTEWIMPGTLSFGE
jgi:prophage tail gpP-like protein